MNKKQHIVFIHEDIIDESSMDNDATVELTTTNNNIQNSSPPPSSPINNNFVLPSNNHQVRTNIIKTRPIQERTRSQHVQNEIMAMIEL